MQRRIGDVIIDSVAAEAPKFTAPMLLVHGLWCTAAVWRRFMGYLAHRGWMTHALTLRGHAADSDRAAIGRVRFADYLDDVRRVVAACDAPPVVVGHDIGALLALHCRPQEVRAAVAVAPLVPDGSAPGLRFLGLGARFAMWRTRALPAPTGHVAVDYFGPGAPGGTTPDSGCVAGELMRNEIPAPAASGVPTLIIGGTRDVIAPPDAVRRLAQPVGATLRLADGASHAMPWEPGWEQRVSEVHRWVVQALGENLLLPPEDEDG